MKKLFLTLLLLFSSSQAFGMCNSGEDSDKSSFFESSKEENIKEEKTDGYGTPEKKTSKSGTSSDFFSSEISIQKFEDDFSKMDPFTEDSEDSFDHAHSTHTSPIKAPPSKKYHHKKSPTKRRLFFSDGYKRSCSFELSDDDDNDNEFEEESFSDNDNEFEEESFSDNDNEFEEESFSDNDNQNKGKIILILGTSCSGKTSIAQKLKNELNISYMPSDSIEQEEMDEYEKKYKPFKKKQNRCFETEHLLMIKKAKKLAKKGFNVICDTVPVNSSEENITQQLINAFKDNNFETYTILIYTDYKICLNRIQLRSNNGTIEDEIRSPRTILTQFSTLYKKSPPSPTKKSHPKKMPQTNHAKIKANIKSPEIERSCLSSSANSFLNGRLWAKVQDGLIDKKQDITKFIVPSVGIYEHIFMNNEEENSKHFTIKFGCLLGLLDLWIDEQTK